MSGEIGRLAGGRNSKGQEPLGSVRRAFIARSNGLVPGSEGLEMLARLSYYDYNLEPCMEGRCSNASVGLDAMGGDV